MNTGSRFCSMRCYGMYRRSFGNDTKYDSTVWNTELRDAIKERDNLACAICGQRGCKRHRDSMEQGTARLAVHHIDRDKGNSVPENLITLCWYCHQHVHLRNEYRKQVTPTLMEIARERSG